MAINQSPEHYAFMSSALEIFMLLIIATAVHRITSWIKIPYSVGLLLTGFFLVQGADMFLPQLSDVLTHISFSPEIVFFILLPSLIFESAYHLKFRDFKGAFREIGVLSSVGLCISTGIIGVGLNYFMDLPLELALLFGAVISATDPVAVLAIFKELRVPRKLSTIVDGESLVNDGVALVLMAVFLTMVQEGNGVVFAFSDLATLLYKISFGTILGVFLGAGLALAISKARTKEIQLTLSLILAHATFLAAESLGLSGILATMAAGLVMGNYGKRKITPALKASFADIWSFLGFISNVLIFLLLGLKIGQIDLLSYWEWVTVACIISLFIARPISVLISFFITNLTRDPKHRIPFNYQFVTIWGGLRGALAAVAILLIPEETPYFDEVQAMTVGVILFTFVVNAPTVKELIRKLNITKLKPLDKIQQSEVEILITQELMVYLRLLLRKKYITKGTHEKLTQRYGNVKLAALKKLKELQKTHPGHERATNKILSYYALGIEYQQYRRLYYDYQEIPEDRYVVLSASIMRQMDLLDEDVLPEEREKNMQIAPQIPEPWTILKTFTCLTPFYKKHKAKQVLRRWHHYRARRIASWKVVTALLSTEKECEVFRDHKTLLEIVERYKRWNENAESKMNELGKRFPSIVSPERTKIAERVCQQREQKIELDLIKKGLLTERVKSEVDTDFCRIARENRSYTKR